MPSPSQYTIMLASFSFPAGSSSGLHHDFHDNLYILLRGSKRFRLFPPSTAPDMYVRGTIKHIYPNGRIVYDGQGDIQADGSSKCKHKHPPSC